MPRPTNRAELLEAMGNEFERLLRQVDAVAPEDQLKVGACDAWSVKDILAHLDAWHGLFLTWEATGSAGGKPEMPAPGYSWKETPALNAAIHARTKDDDPDEVRRRLFESHDRVRVVVASYSDDDLFTKRRFAWTASTSVGSYAVSATSSHYDWARKLIRAFARSLAEADR